MKLPRGITATIAGNEVHVAVEYRVDFVRVANGYDVYAYRPREARQAKHRGPFGIPEQLADIERDRLTYSRADWPRAVRRATPLATIRFT